MRDLTNRQIKKRAKNQPDSVRMNQIKPATNASFNLVFFLLAAISIIPVIFVFMISISSELSIRQVGYSFVPVDFSTAAYMFLWHERATIMNALFVSVFVTLLGTLLGLALTTTMGYVLSRPIFKMKKFYSWVVFIPMIFNGGMVASYVVIANILQLRDTFWSLILPLAVSSFNILISKTFFQSTIPDSVVESAKIDGASQLRIFRSVVLPISKPVLATIGLFLVFGYWNDWFQSSLYVSNANMVSLQALLNNMMRMITYIANNPSAGLSLQQYRNTMPTESVRMAIAIVIVIPIACAYPFFQKYFITGLTIGAVKG